MDTFFVILSLTFIYLSLKARKAKQENQHKEIIKAIKEAKAL